MQLQHLVDATHARQGRQMARNSLEKRGLERMPVLENTQGNKLVEDNFTIVAQDRKACLQPHSNTVLEGQKEKEKTSNIELYVIQLHDMSKFNRNFSTSDTRSSTASSCAAASHDAVTSIMPSSYYIVFIQSHF